MSGFLKRTAPDADALIASAEEMAKGLAAIAPKDRRMTLDELFQLETVVCNVALEKPRQAWADQGSVMRDTLGPAIERLLHAEVRKQFIRHLPTNVLPEGTA